MGDDRWWRDLDTVVAATLPAGARVLDVGCGDGGLVDRLVELGLDATGVDPRAPSRERLLSSRVEDVLGAEPFDALTAVMSLHHADLDAFRGAVARLLRPGGHVLVSELVWEAFDERASEWLERHGATGGTTVADWRREHRELHTSDAVRTCVSREVELRVDVPRPYLARKLGRPELEPEERALVDAGLLPALGRWLHGVR